MSFGGIKRTPADKAFSDCVREAHDYTCQHCGKNNRHNPQACHLSHFYGRRGRSTRWHKDNGFCLCAGCHNYLGEHPLEHSNWVKSILGEGCLDLLTERAYKPMKISKLEEKDIAKHYREQLKIIKEKRANGEEGYIDFIGY
jgi:hypothetical protein